MITFASESSPDGSYVYLYTLRNGIRVHTIGLKTGQPVDARTTDFLADALNKAMVGPSSKQDSMPSEQGGGDK